VQNVGVGNGQQQWSAMKAGAVALTSAYVPFPVRMRANPTITLFNPAAANAQVRDFDGTADTSASVAQNVSERGFVVTCTGNAGTAVGNNLLFHWTASAEL
jgi:hypothetical protein